MKKILSLLIALLLCASLFVGCDNVLSQNGGSQTTDDTTDPDSINSDNEITNNPDSSKTLYTVEIANSENYPILNELKDSYEVGEKVTIELETITEHYYVLYVNGVEQSPDESISNDWSVTYYTFSMPAENVIITIEDRWVEIPEDSQETSQHEEHDWQIVSQDNGCWYSAITYACSKCDMEQNAEIDWALPNHSWTEETTDGKTTFACTRCNESNTYMSEIREFSYAQVLEEYKIGDPDVKHENFNNPAIEREITNVIDAITRAKFELTIEYDTISVFYDETSNMWRVDFWTLNMDGNCQSVYVNGNGLTCYEIIKKKAEKVTYSGEMVIGLLNIEATTESQLILDLLNNGKWVDDVCECIHDYTISLNGKVLRYSSYCGTFNNTTDGSSLALSADDKAAVNEYLESLFEGFDPNEE